MTGHVRFVGRISLFIALAASFGVVTSVHASPPTTPPSTEPQTAPSSSTGPSLTGPIVTLDRAEVSPGEHLVLAIDGFAARSVTISVCGNQARRGSADCNMAASQSVETRVDGSPTMAEIPVAAPPVGCPCLVRVSSRLNDEVAIAPFTLVGHPIDPVVGGANSDDPLVAVTVSAQASPRGLLGWMRSNLGGAVPHTVTVTVKNITTETLHHVTVFGSLGHNADDQIAALPLDDPGEIGPGQTWTQVVAADVPAPSLSRVYWQVVAAGAGPWVTATTTTRHRPMLLIVVLMALIIDILILVVRKRARRRAARDAASVPEMQVDDNAISSDACARPRELESTSS